MDKPADYNETESLAKELLDSFNSLNSVIDESSEKEGLFEALYEDFPISVGKATSRDERQQNNYVSTTLVYGEINFKPFSQQFLKLKNHGLPESGGMFIDIGCGTGKPVFAAALLHDFDICIGIEILEKLHGICEQVLSNWKRTIRHQCSRRKHNMEIKFIHGDATAINWSEADVVFANSTCFDDALMDKLAECANRLRSGAIVVTTTKRLPSTKFEVVEISKMTETWGDATVFIQKKRQLRIGRSDSTV